ncbi:MAG: hypothetical protein ACI395_04835, partial [Candidatus Cryptobacteroides sp.]
MKNIVKCLICCVLAFTVNAHFSFSAVCAAARPSASEGEPVPEVRPDDGWLREHYTKRTEMVRMRDGVSLHTTLYE